MKKNILVLPGWGLNSSAMDVFLDLTVKTDSDIHLYKLDFYDESNYSDEFDPYSAVKNYISKNSLKTFDIISWSMGSLLGFNLLTDRKFIESNGITINKFIAFGPTAKFTKTDEDENDDAFSKRHVLLLKKQVSSDKKNTLLKFYESFFTKEELDNDNVKSFLKNAESNIEILDPDILSAGLDYLVSSDFKDSLSKIESDILLIKGDKDNICKPYGAELIKRITNAKLLTVKNAGHMTFLSHPKTMADKVREFVFND